MEYSDRLKRSLSGHAKRTLQKQREEGALKKNTKITEHFQFRATPVVKSKLRNSSIIDKFACEKARKVPI